MRAGGCCRCALPPRIAKNRTGADGPFSGARRAEPADVKTISGPVVLIVLDGYGLREDPRDNAVAMAGKPNLDRFTADYPHTRLAASEMKVGLPEGQMGNS